MEETGEVNGAITLGTISVFTSVKKMWNSESVSTRISIVLLSLVNLTLNGLQIFSQYALAILIVILSICCETVILMILSD